jgi:hypothetical protein
VSQKIYQVSLETQFGKPVVTIYDESDCELIRKAIDPLKIPRALMDFLATQGERIVCSLPAYRLNRRVGSDGIQFFIIAEYIGPAIP